MGKTIGIDLGTTNSVVSVMEGNEPTVIANEEGGRVTPSVVAFTGKDRLVGQAARRQAVTNPRNTVFSIKRFMGRRHSEVDAEEKLVPYDIVGGPDELVRVHVDVERKDFTPPEISAMVLQKLKRTAEAYLGETVTDAVITVPAYFNDSQRQATKDAGRIAGLNVLRIINEPTAAALAYGLDKKRNQKVAVFDLGGGTFDISILNAWEEGGLEVTATNGDTRLGGDDFDQALVNYVADEFKKEHGIDLREDQMALQRLREACEKAKCELSSAVQTDINLPFITADQNGPKHLQVSMTRATFDQITAALVERCRRPCMKALEDAGIEPSAVDEVLLVGGSTRIPAVQELVSDIFGRQPNHGVNPDEVVADGAAIQGGVLAGEVEDMVLLDVTPLSLGIETLGGVMTRLIERNTTIPASQKQVFSTAEDGQTAVEIHVLQGEREMAPDNRTLGRFQLVGIPPAARGVAQIEVSFDIDANGILSVKATDLGTGKEQAVRIESSSGLSKEEIEQMRADADRHAEEDKEKRRLVEERNKADQIIYQVEETLKEHGDNVPAPDRKAVEERIAALKRAREGEDAQAIASGCEALTNAAHAIAQMMYARSAQSQPHAGPGDPVGARTGSDDYVDADFTVVDDDK